MSSCSAFTFTYYLILPGVKVNRYSFALTLSIFFIFIASSGISQRSWDGGGDAVNWSDGNNWDNNAVPLAGESVTLGAGYVITIDGAFTCTNLSLGSGTQAQISASNSLTVTGTLTITDAGGGSDAFLDAAAGTLSVAGVVTLGTAGQNSILVSTGTVSFTSAISLADDVDQDITFSGAGIINFNGGFTDNGSGLLTTFAGCTVNFGGSYTNINNTITWNATSNAVFNGGVPTITPTALITFGNVQINSGITLTLAGDIQVAGNWTNNGGTLSGGANTVTFESIGNSIGGTSSTTFPNLKLGNTLNNVYITLSQNISCTNFSMDADNSSRTIVHDASNPSLTVSGDVTLNQPTSNSKTNLWDIGGGSSTIAGNLVFSGSSNTTSRISKINVTSGSFTLSGNVTWMAGQSTPQAVATEVITVSSGTITFSNSLTMGQGSGTLQVTGAGSINFNGTSAPSLNLNSTVAGNTTNAVFLTLWGSTVNFAAGLTNANTTLTFDDGNTAVFTGNGTITPTAAIIFGSLKIDATPTLTLAGNISVVSNWTNLGGTFTPGTNTVTFSGIATQTITKTGGETFYNLTCNTTGPLTFANDVTITNALAMTSGNININSTTLTLGNSAGATLTRTAGIAYGGTFKRWFPVASISSTVVPLYGLFPVGTSTHYRPVEINSTVNPTNAGYVSNTHTNPPSNNFVTDVTYTDNEGDAIQRIANILASLSTSDGFAGGTYDIYVTYTDLSSTGTLTDLKLETYTSSTMGSVGTTVATSGTAGSPVVKRSGLTAADLVNDFVIGTKNMNPLVTPIRPYYYSRKNGNWSDATVGDGTWSYFTGGAGVSCDCIPVSYGYAVISTGQTVSVDVESTVNFVDISNTSVLNGTATLSVLKDLTTAGSGTFSPTAGSWTISRDLTLAGSGSSSLSAASTVTGNLTIGSGTTLTMSGGVGLTLTGNLAVNGTLALGTSTLTMNGVSGTTLSGSTGAASITGAGATLNVTTASKNFLSGTNLTIAPTLAITGAITLTNNGTVTLTGNLTGSAAGSTWSNEGGSTVNFGGTVLTTGALDGSFNPNTINYNAAGAQSIKIPTSSYYNLKCSTSGTKTFATAGTITVTNLLTIQGAAIFDSGTNVLNGVGGLTMTGTSEFKLADNITVTPGLPQLTGTYNLTGGTITFNRGGNQRIRSLNGPVPSAYYHVSFENSGSKTLDGPITVQGNLAIAGTADLDVSATNYSIDLSGNWNVTSTAGDPFGQRNGTVSFTGSSAQTISNTGDADGTEFYSVTINNTSSTGITLSGTAGNDLIILSGGTFTLTDGYVYTSASNLVQINNGGASGGGSASSFVDGPIKKIGDEAFTFPTGDDVGTAGFSSGDQWARVGITAPATASTEFTAEYTYAAYTDLSVDGTLTRTSSVEYWKLDRAVNADNVNVTLYFENSSASGISDYTSADLVVARYNGTDWVDNGQSSISGTDPGSVTSNAVSSFNTQFSFGSKTGNNSLPITLLLFEAKINGDIVDVLWSTATESNNDYFTLERSPDGVTFSEVKKVKGAGYSNERIDYSDIDPDPLPGFSYYRLKQTDFDGKFSYSHLAPVNFNPSPEFTISPNPLVLQETPNLNITGLEKEKGMLLNIFTIEGKAIFSTPFKSNTSGESVISIDPSIRPGKGIYIIYVTCGQKTYRQKLVIQ